MTIVMTAYLHERVTLPCNALFCGPPGKQHSRDPLEHGLQSHLPTVAANCTSLADKHVTMHTLRHTASINLRAAGVDISSRRRALDTELKDALSRILQQLAGTPSSASTREGPLDPVGVYISSLDQQMTHVGLVLQLL